MIGQAVASFVTEAREILEDLEDQLLRLETAPSQGLIDAIFRALHTIKGSGAMFGFVPLSQFTHHFETAFEAVRSGRLEVSKPLVDVSLQARDHMAQLLELGAGAPAPEDDATSENEARILDALAALTGGGPATPPADAGPAPAQATDNATEKHYEIWFRPARGDLRNGMRPDLLAEELSQLGALTVEYDISALPDGGDPTDAWLGWLLRLTTTQGLQAIEDVFIFADSADIDIAEVAASHTAAPSVQGPAEATNDDAAPEPSGGSKTSATAPKSAGRAPGQGVSAGEHVRVSSARLDEMMDRLGELVIAQARLERISSGVDDPALGGIVEEIQRLVVGLRDVTMSIRMLPIETVFGKFRRVVRDLSAELGKSVELVTDGGETEVDKNIIDRLSDPLVHMIRNSVDHGLESDADRAAVGKPATGTVRLSARQEGGEIVITVEDDGKGLNTQAIRTRAIERGLLSEDATPSDSDIHQLIFEPGFSTAATVSSVSGRGVGMDAVRSTVAALRGVVEVASRPGEGSRISLRLPVTLAIIDGLLVKLAGATYVIPLSTVEECVELDTTEATRRSGRTMLQIREHLVPFLQLDEMFGSPPTSDAGKRVVIVRADGARIGLVVDDIVGQSQTVIKTLSAFHRDIPGFAGATILGDGAVALIVDVATLVRSAALTMRDQHAA